MPKFEIYLDRGGTYRWRLKAGNGEIVAISEGYTTITAAENSARHLKQWSGLASIVRI